jgi:hypothetical protein
MEKMYVDVRVQKIIREFIIATNGSDYIVPSPKSLLWQLVKQHLKVVPSNYVPVVDRSEYVRVELLNTHSAKVLTRKMKGAGKGAFRDVVLNTCYRSYLDERGQAAVVKQFRKSFKECLHNFVMGSIFDNPLLLQRQAIDNFCSVYHLTLDEINYEMLIKSWMRSPQRARIKGQDSSSPVVF